MSLEWYGDKIKLDINNGTIKALLRASDLVRSTAILKVPVDTGNLRGSIVKTVDTKRYVGTVSTNVEYAPSVEFGTRRQTAQPFMRPALSDNFENIKKIFIQEEKEQLD